MRSNTSTNWQHDHTFGQDRRMPGERRTMIVIAITATMMVVEITTGVLFGSMALLADGLHMASHTVALAISYFAYVYARRHARDDRYNFGTGKVNSLAGFTGAVLLAVFALMMVAESVDRFIHPIPIQFNQAIFVAVVGLLVNAASALILGVHDHSGHEHSAHDHSEHGHSHDHSHSHEDHNLRSAYLHVIADAMTSVLAIFALLTGKYFGAIWMDPAMGIVGAVLVANWSLGLARISSRVLLDRQGPEQLRAKITEAVQSDGSTVVSDLHLWAVGPGVYAAIVAVVTPSPRLPLEYKSRIPAQLGLVHVTVEVNLDPPPTTNET